MNGRPSVHGDLAVGIGAVHSRGKGRGLGSLLAERSEARARGRGASRMHQVVVGADPAAARLLLEGGYREARRFYEMAIELDGEPPAPAAAAVRNEANRNGGGRGLGRALLLHTFREFHARGIDRVTLGVDAASPTGATRLYDGVGMGTEKEHVVYEKALR